MKTIKFKKDKGFAHAGEIHRMSEAVADQLVHDGVAEIYAPSPTAVAEEPEAARKSKFSRRGRIDPDQEETSE